MADRRLNVLFLCTANSARSIIAESVLRHVGGDRFEAFSAGSHPTGRVNPQALATLRAHGLPTESLHSKSWDTFAGSGAPAMDIVITVCDNAAGEACPVWPGAPITAHWGLPDPAAIQRGEAEIREAFAATLQTLMERIQRFVQMPPGSLDRPEIQRLLRELGGAQRSNESRP